MPPRVLPKRPILKQRRPVDKSPDSTYLSSTSGNPRCIRFESVVRVINDGSSSPLKEGTVAYVGEWLRAELVEKRLEQVFSKPASLLTPQDIYDVVYAQSESMLSAVHVYDPAGPPVQKTTSTTQLFGVAPPEPREDSAYELSNMDKDTDDQPEDPEVKSVPETAPVLESLGMRHTQRSSSTVATGIFCCFRRSTVRSDDPTRSKVSMEKEFPRTSVSRNEKPNDFDLSSPEKTTEETLAGMEACVSPAQRRSTSLGLVPDFDCERIYAHLHTEGIRILAMDLVKYRAGNVFHDACIAFICRSLLPHRVTEICTGEPIQFQWLKELGCSVCDTSILFGPYSMLAMLLTLQYISSHLRVSRRLLQSDVTQTIGSAQACTDVESQEVIGLSQGPQDRTGCGASGIRLGGCTASSAKPEELTMNQKRDRFYFLELCLRLATALIHLLRHGRLNAICNYTDRVRLALDLLLAGWLADFWKRWERGRIHSVEAYILAAQKKIADGIGVLAMIRAGTRTEDASAIALYD